MVGAIILALAITSAASPALACRRHRDRVAPTPEQVEAGFRASLLVESTEIYLAEVVTIERQDGFIPVVSYSPSEALRGTRRDLLTTDGDLVINTCGTLINSGWYDGMKVGDQVIVFIGSPFGAPRVQHVDPLGSVRASTIIDTLRGRSE
jgi:hypothetical protein